MLKIPVQLAVGRVAGVVHPDHLDTGGGEQADVEIIAGGRAGVIDAGTAWRQMLSSRAERSPSKAYSEDQRSGVRMPSRPRTAVRKRWLIWLRWVSVHPRYRS